MDEYARKYQTYIIKQTTAVMITLYKMFKYGDTDITEEEMKDLKSIRDSINNIIVEDMNKWLM